MLLGTAWGTHNRSFIRNHREDTRNGSKTSRKNLNPIPSQRGKKNVGPPKSVFEPSYWVHKKFLFLKLGHHFWLRLKSFLKRMG